MGADSPRRIEWILFGLFLLAAGLSFLDYFRIEISGGDDLMWRNVLEEMEHPSFSPHRADEQDPSLLRRLGDCFTARSLAGHYAPVRAAIWVLQFEIAGSDRWTRSVILTSFILHAATAAFLGVLLRRLGAGAAAALATGLVYACHPVSDVPLANANAGMNVIGSFFLLAALVAWDRHLRSGGILVLIGATLSFFAALNSNVIYFVVGPLAFGAWVGLTTLFGEPERRISFRALCLRTMPLLLAFLSALAMRWFWYGRLGSRDEVASERIEGKSDFFTVMFQTFFRFSQGKDVYGRPSWLVAPPESFVTSLPARLAVAAVVVLGAASIFVLLRGAEGSRPGPIAGRSRRRSGPLRAATFGLIVFAITAGSYYAVRGTAWPHRYYQLALLGFAPLAGAAIACCVAAAGKRGPLVGAVLVAGVLASFAPTNLESQRSACFASRIMKTISETVAREIDSDPDIAGVYVLRAPRAVPRAGVAFSFDLSLSSGISSARRALAGTGRADRVIRAFHEDSLVESWADLAEHADLRARCAVFAYDTESDDCRRVREVENPNASRDVVLEFPVGSASSAGRRDFLRVDERETKRLSADPGALRALARNNPARAAEILASSRIDADLLREFSGAASRELRSAARAQLMRSGTAAPEVDATTDEAAEATFLDTRCSAHDRILALRTVAARSGESRLFDLLWESVLHAPLDRDLVWGLPDLVDLEAPSFLRRLVISALDQERLPAVEAQRIEALVRSRFGDLEVEAGRRGLALLTLAMRTAAAGATPEERGRVAASIRDLPPAARRPFPELEILAPRLAGRSTFTARDAGSLSVTVLSRPVGGRPIRIALSSRLERHLPGGAGPGAPVVDLGWSGAGLARSAHLLPWDGIPPGATRELTLVAPPSEGSSGVLEVTIIAMDDAGVPVRLTP